MTSTEAPTGRTNRISGGICLNCRDSFHSLCWNLTHTDQLYNSCFCQHKDNSDGKYHAKEVVKHGQDE